MASSSPSPDSSPPPSAAPPPDSSNTPPPLPPLSSPPPQTQPNDTVPSAAPPSPPITPSPPPASALPPITASPPSQSPPPASAAPPPQTASPPPNPVTSSPPATPTPPVVPPPSSNAPPPLPSTSPLSSSPPPPPTPSDPPPPVNPLPPQTPDPPHASPPPPTPSDPPVSTPPPQTPNPPRVSPPPPQSATPPNSSPPPEPPKSALPPSVPPKPPESPPLTPPSEPSKPSPPPRSSPAPPQGSPSPPSPPSPSRPPQTSPPSPVSTPPPAGSPPSLGSPPRQSPPAATGPPSPPSRPSLSPPSPSLVPPGAPTNSTSDSNAPETSGSNGGGGNGNAVILAIGLVLGFLLLGLVGGAVWCLWKRKKKVLPPGSGYIVPTSPGPSPKPEPELLEVQVSGPSSGSGPGRNSGSSLSEPNGLGNSRSWFTYGELAEATNGFSHQNLLGEGGFGSVYKGRLSDGREVAVKQLKVGGGQGDREFRAEVEIIGRVHHRHLVSLVGYCISEDRKLLVYDYLPNDTLHFHLHGEGRPVFDWSSRVKIAVGAARGIAYLHEDCHPRIIHRDIKSSNILLDDNFEARVSDFGLAKLFLDSNTHVTTRVMGTFGYMAPEYASSGKLTDKSDVFSFGVVLLELITGRKPVDTNQPLGDESLVEWARPLLSHALETEEFEALVDPRLEKNYVPSEMFRMIEAAAACVRHSSAKRPRMIQVVRAFDVMSTMDLTNGMRVGESEMFDSAEQSAEIRLFRRMAFGSHNISTDFFSQAGANGEQSG